MFLFGMASTHSNRLHSSVAFHSVSSRLENVKRRWRLTSIICAIGITETRTFDRSWLG